MKYDTSPANLSTTLDSFPKIGGFLAKSFLTLKAAGLGFGNFSCVGRENHQGRYFAIQLGGSYLKTSLPWFQ